jgi:GMP synthase-like glutamine amidotransferase
MKRVLAIQHIWDDPPGYLGEILQEHGIAYDTVEVEKEPFPAFNAYDALIVLGGPQHAPADHRFPYFTQEKAAIREAVEQDIPLLGICLGGQLLAHALGASVTRHHLTEIGFSKVQFTEEGCADPLFQGLPGYQQVVQWHEDTFNIPPNGVLLATNSYTRNQAFRVGRCAYGLQYHIELTPEMLDTWLRFPDYKKEIIKVKGPDAPDAIERERSSYYPIFREHTRILFENFLHISNLT